VSRRLVLLVLFALFALAAALAPAPAGAAPAPPAAPGAAPDAPADLTLFDRVYMRGNPEPLEGTIIEETADEVRFARKDSQVPYLIAKRDIEKIVRADKPERVYEERARRVAAEDADGHLALARFCLKHGLERQAAREASLAAAAAGAREAARSQAIEAYRLLSLVLRARYGKVSPDFFADVRERELEAYERAEAAGALVPDLRLAKARLLRDAGDREGALAELEKLAAALPPTPTAAAAPAPLLPATGADDVPAGLDLDRAVRLELGDLALALGRIDQAEAAYRAAAALPPSPDRRALEGLGLAAFARGDLAAAASNLDAACAAAPSVADPVVYRGIVALHAGDLDRAESLFARAHELRDDRPELFLYEGMAAAIRGKEETAARLLTRAAGPDADPATLVEATLGQGLALEIAGRPGEAIAKYVEGLGLVAPEGKLRSPGLAPLAGLAALVRAEAHAARGESPLAEDALREAASLGYDFPTIAAAIARARRDVKDYATAIRFGRYASARRPGDPDILCGLGRSYLGAGQMEEAEAAFDAALARAPDDVEAIDGKARVLYGRGERDAAEKLFRRARELDPDDAYAALALRRLDEARERRLWRDDFRRADGQDVRNRWDEDERFGIQAAIRGRRLVLSGKQVSEDMGRTQVTRTVEGAQFAELRVRLDAARAGAARAGIRLTVRDGEVAFFRAPDGSVAYATRLGSKKDWTDPVRVGMWPRDAGAHELWLAVGGPNRDELIFGMDQDEAARAKLTPFGKASSFACGIYVQAPVDAPVEVTVEEARIFVAREKRAGKSGGY
jgi:tetratricopeptide (TPR) repeat protein